MRRDLGAVVNVATPTLRLDPERITSDVADFRAAIAAKEWATAAALYTGPFLDHFHLQHRVGEVARGNGLVRH